MDLCMLDLGADPWSRLAEGSVTGTFRWNDGPTQQVGVRIRGAHSRRFPKRSLQVTFRGARWTDGPPAGHTVRRIHLNADYVDPTLLRSYLSYALFDQVGVDAPRCRHVALTVSGRFAGVYVALESVDGDFCRRRGWEPGPIFYAVNRNANFGLLSPFTRAVKEPLEKGYLPVDGADPTALQKMLMAINLASDESFPRVAQRWIDVDRYLHWLMVAVFVGNRDGFLHNYALYQEPDEGRYRIIPWDYDATWGIDIHGRPARLDRVPVVGWNKLSHRLLTIPACRRLYQRRFLARLEDVLSPEAIAQRVEAIRPEIAPWVKLDHAKRGSYAQFPREVERLKRWAVDRGALVRSALSQLD